MNFVYIICYSMDQINYSYYFPVQVMNRLLQIGFFDIYAPAMATPERLMFCRINLPDAATIWSLNEYKWVFMQYGVVKDMSMINLLLNGLPAIGDLFDERC